MLQNYHVTSTLRFFWSGVHIFARSPPSAWADVGSLQNFLWCYSDWQLSTILAQLSTFFIFFVSVIDNWRCTAFKAFHALQGLLTIFVNFPAHDTQNNDIVNFSLPYYIVYRQSSIYFPIIYWNHHAYRYKSISPPFFCFLPCFPCFRLLSIVFICLFSRLFASKLPKKSVIFMIMLILLIMRMCSAVLWPHGWFMTSGRYLCCVQ